MTNCEYCDYYKVMNNNGKDTEKVSACLFTDYIFAAADVGNSDMEYPCRDITYQEYLGKSKKKTYVNQSGLKNDDWKLTYRSKHPVAERNRTKVAV